MKKNGVNRRDFLRLSATAGAGAFLLPDASAASLNPSVTKQSNDFPVRTLGRTGIKIPIVSMGVMRADNPNVVRAAYNSGITFFDTAHGYQEGRNEEMLGNFFKGKPRDSFYIATKCKFRGDPDTIEDFDAMYTAMLDLSLSRLQMNFVDIFYVHDLNTPEVVKNEKVINIINKFKADGKAKFVGFSIHAAKPDVIDAAVESGAYDVILLGYNFKQNNLKEIDESIERAVKAGIGIVAMKTMTGGTEDADGKKKINAQACLKWAWNNKNIATAIPGFANFTELEECLAAAKDPALSSGEKEYLASLCSQEMLYCQQCGQCLSQCPEKLPIPDLMRAYMYAYGYKNASLSKETLLELNLAQQMCTGCDKCTVKCVSGFKVSEKIAAITPVMQVSDVFLT